MSKAARCTWVFGTDPDKNAAGVPNTHGKHNNVLGSTGAGTPFNCHALGQSYTFEIETNDSNWAYQIRVGRTSSGPWTAMSSGSGTSTANVNTDQMAGPLRWVSPRVDTMASTLNYVIITMDGYEAP